MVPLSKKVVSQFVQAQLAAPIIQDGEGQWGRGKEKYNAGLAIILFSIPKSLARVNLRKGCMATTTQPGGAANRASLSAVGNVLRI